MKHGCFKLLLVFFLFQACGSNDNVSALTQPLPPLATNRKFSLNGENYAPMDFQSVNLSTDFLFTEKKSSNTAEIHGSSREDGFPFFLMNADPSFATIDGTQVDIVSISDPDGKNRLRVINRKFSKGEKFNLFLKFDTPSREVTYDSGGVRFFTSMSDIGSGNYLEAFAPSGFEDDPFKLKWNISIDGATNTHQIFSNGKYSATGPNAWEIEFPKYFVSSSFYLHLTNLPLFVRSGSAFGINGPIPLTVYSQEESLAEVAIAQLPNLFHELEDTYGPYAHESFTAYISGRGGMEYCGATITSLGALAHELTHSWFARGVMPSDARSGWLDEAIASWRDNGYFRATSTGGRASTNLGRFSAFQRFSPSNVYVDGRNFLAELDLLFAYRGGLRPLLRDFFSLWQKKSIHTGDFQAHLERVTGHDLRAQFSAYVYAGDSGFQDPAETTGLKLSLHPNPLTREEILKLR